MNMWPLGRFMEKYDFAEISLLSVILLRRYEMCFSATPSTSTTSVAATAPE
jgi:hypothetical protein